MVFASCPRCRRFSRRLERPRLRVTYFRCDPCKYLWAIDNSNPDSPQTILLPRDWESPILKRVI
jgi:hypothetical protein